MYTESSRVFVSTDLRISNQNLYTYMSPCGWDDVRNFLFNWIPFLDVFSWTWPTVLNPLDKYPWTAYWTQVLSCIYYISFQCVARSLHHVLDGWGINFLKFEILTATNRKMFKFTSHWIVNHQLCIFLKSTSHLNILPAVGWRLLIISYPDWNFIENICCSPF